MPDGVPGCILVRALEPLLGMEEMAALREITLEGTKNLKLLTSGPGRLSEAFGITREHDNGKDLTSPKSDLYVADDGFNSGKIAITPELASANRRIAATLYHRGKQIRIRKNSCGGGACPTNGDSAKTMLSIKRVVQDKQQPLPAMAHRFFLLVQALPDERFQNNPTGLKAAAQTFL